MMVAGSPRTTGSMAYKLSMGIVGLSCSASRAARTFCLKCATDFGERVTPRSWQRLHAPKAGIGPHGSVRGVYGAARQRDWISGDS